ncbi:hypothetical protein XACB100_660018 [Xanthomonas citri pv. citri]|nr:hypothetical protein XACB100_660018 [Xanthomonas citri pv. citri]
MGSERGGRCGTDRPGLPDMRAQRLRAARIPCAATPARARALAAWWEWNLVVGSDRALARDRNDGRTAPGLIASTNLALLPRTRAATSLGHPIGPRQPSTGPNAAASAASRPHLRGNKQTRVPQRSIPSRDSCRKMLHWNGMACASTLKRTHARQGDVSATQRAFGVTHTNDQH